MGLPDEREGLAARARRARIDGGGVIEIPGGAPAPPPDLRRRDAARWRELDDLFWGRMQGAVSGELLAAVHPVGGGMKLAALEQIVAAEGRGDDVMYVGDSITDAPALAPSRRGAASR